MAEKLKQNKKEKVNMVSKSNLPVLVGGIVAALLLIAGTVFVTSSLMNTNKSTDSTSKTTDTDELVPPKNVQEKLSEANDAAQEEAALHDKAASAMNEQQTKLAN